MPHTSHKIRPVRAKRKDVPLEDGWTVVASLRNSNNQGISPNNRTKSSGQSIHQKCDAPNPFSPNPDVSLKQLLEAYRKIETIWKRSPSCQELSKCLRERILTTDGLKITRCVCFGTGSFSGVGNGAWINRSDVAIFQLAAFKSAVDVINEQIQLPYHSIESYAQEPRYNELDHELLKILHINPVPTPKGFSLISPSTLAYLPGGEPSVVLRTLEHNPGVYMGSNLDFYATASQNHGLDYSAFSTYILDKNRTRIIDLEAANAPFHEVNIYWANAHAAECEDEHGSNNQLFLESDAIANSAPPS